MKKIIIALTVFTCSFSAFSFEKAKFVKIAKNTVKQALSGKVSDIDALIADQKMLFSLGVAGCKEHVKKAKGQEKKLMELIIKKADSMLGETLESIEEKWHDGGELKAAGITLGEDAHMGHANSLADAVIHPATTYIALNVYKKKADKELLVQVKDELAEVLEHVSHIK